MQFFFIRFLIFAFLISLTAVWAHGLEGVKTNPDGVIFNVLFYSISGSIAYFIVLFLASFLATIIT